MSCNSKMQNKNQTENIKLKPLSPYTFEFKGKNEASNRIDYFYLKGKFQYEDILYRKLNKIISEHYKKTKNQYKLFSIYIYKETEELNESYDKTRESFDGKNNDLLAYVRFSNTVNDIFYIIENGFVIYDCVNEKSLNFEFEQ